MKTKSLPFAVLLLISLFSTSVYAGKYDLDLKRLWKLEDNKWTLVGKDYFEGLIGDIGSTVAPRFLGPAATLGSLGFQVALDWSMTNIPENAERWQYVMTDPTSGSGQQGADSFLQTLTLHVRKGLPFSAEVGGTFTRLLNSDLWGVGVEMKYAALEGFTYLPELSFRGSISTFLGTRDYALLTAGGDVILSKKIGIAGLFKLAPYLGYSLLYVHGSSNVIPVDIETAGNPVTANITQQVFESADVFKNYFVAGFQVVGTIVNGGFEAAITSNLQTYSLRLGVEF